MSSIEYPSEGHEFGKYESRTLVWYSDLHEIKWHPINVKIFVPGKQGKKEINHHQKCFDFIFKKFLDAGIQDVSTSISIVHDE